MAQCTGDGILLVDLVMALPSKPSAFRVDGLYAVTGEAGDARGAAAEVLAVTDGALLEAALEGFDPDQLKHSSYDALTASADVHPEQLIKPLDLAGLSFVPASDALAVLEFQLRMDAARSRT